MCSGQTIEGWLAGYPDGSWQMAGSRGDQPGLDTVRNERKKGGGMREPDYKQETQDRQRQLERYGRSIG